MPRITLILTAIASFSGLLPIPDAHAEPHRAALIIGNATYASLPGHPRLPQIRQYGRRCAARSGVSGHRASGCLDRRRRRRDQRIFRSTSPAAQHRLRLYLRLRHGLQRSDLRAADHGQDRPAVRCADPGRAGEVDVRADEPRSGNRRGGGLRSGPETGWPAETWYRRFGRAPGAGWRRHHRGRRRHPDDNPTPLATALVAALAGPQVRTEALLASVRARLPGSQRGDPLPGPARLPRRRPAAAPAAAMPRSPPVGRQPRHRAASRRRGALPAKQLPDEAQMTEADRRQVQAALVRLGYYGSPVDGSVRPGNPRRDPALSA